MYYLNNKLETRYAEFFESIKKDQSTIDLINSLNEKKYSIKHSDASYRVVNRWTDLELIDEERTSNSNWRKFSFIDLIWINIITKLRTFGLSTDQLLNTKKYLFDSQFNGRKYYFEFFLIQAMRQQLISLIVLTTGVVFLDEQDNVRYNQKLAHLNDFIHINFYELVHDFMDSPKISIQSTRPILLSLVETELIGNIRSGSYKKVEIKTANGEIHRINLTQEIHPETKINDLLKNGSFEDISLVKHDGKVISISRTVKQKYGK